MIILIMAALIVTPIMAAGIAISIAGAMQQEVMTTESGMVKAVPDFLLMEGNKDGQKITVRRHRAPCEHKHDMDA